MKLNEGVILCKSDGASMYFFCPWCMRDHVHGRIPGVRASHCFASNSKIQGEYKIREEFSDESGLWGR